MAEKKTDRVNQWLEERKQNSLAREQRMKARHAELKSAAAEAKTDAPLKRAIEQGYMYEVIENIDTAGFHVFRAFKYRWKVIDPNGGIVKAGYALTTGEARRSCEAKLRKIGK